jgi:hypothetical protein
MIDPLSLATSVLTLTDAAVRIGHFISRCRNAPAELMALNNEINDLRYVLTRIRDVYPPDAKGDISAILDRASEKADQLSVVVQLLEGEENGKLSTYQRLKWSAMKHKVSRSRGDLRELRLQLNVFLAAENV